MARLTTKLKAERIQQKLEAGQIREKLKAERIQQKLEALPGWRTARDGNALRRAFELPTAETATHLATLVSGLADSVGFHPRISLHAGRVTLTIDTDGEAGLTDLDFDLAELFGLAAPAPPDEADLPETELVVD